MIANERRNIEFMRQGQDKHQRAGQQPHSGARLVERTHLNADQQRAVNEILSNRDKVVGFQGIAGSGKTTTLREIRIAAQRDGYKVQGFAPTSRATAQLQEAGIRSTHSAAPSCRTSSPIERAQPLRRRRVQPCQHEANARVVRAHGTERPCSARRRHPTAPVGRGRPSIPAASAGGHADGEGRRGCPTARSGPEAGRSRSRGGPSAGSVQPTSRAGS